MIGARVSAPSSPLPPQGPSLGLAILSAWATACLVVPAAAAVAAHLANVLGLPHGPCGDHEPAFAMLAAAWYGIPSALVLTGCLAVMHRLGRSRRAWTLTLLVLYALATTAFFASGSDWCT